MMETWKKTKNIISVYIPAGAVRVLDRMEKEGSLTEPAFSFYVYGFIDSDTADKIEKAIRKTGEDPARRPPLPFLKKNPENTEYLGAITVSKERYKSIVKREPTEEEDESAPSPERESFTKDIEA